MKKFNRKNDMDKLVIVSRHPGQIEWLKDQGIEGPVLPHVSDPEEIAGKVVVGNVPLHLAARAHLVVTVSMPNLDTSQRGKDLSPDEMDAAGAHLSCYSVQAYGVDLEDALDALFRDNWTLQTSQ